MDEDDFLDRYEDVIPETDEEMRELFHHYADTLLKEAEEMMFEEQKKGEAASVPRQYESGGVVRRLTFNAGIDSDFLDWWFVALNARSDGSPFYIICRDGETMQMCPVLPDKIQGLIDGFKKVDEKELENLESKENEGREKEETAIPAISDVPPRTASDDDWEVVINKSSAENGDPTLFLRRASLLDRKGLKSYVLETQNYDTDRNGDTSRARVPVGSFWGHHAMHVADGIEKTIKSAREIETDISI